MTNEELALQIRAGERGRITELWARVRRFALWRARRWAAFGRGVTVDDLEQEAFIALLDALERWREADGPLLSVYAGSKQRLQRPQGGVHSATASTRSTGPSVWTLH